MRHSVHEIWIITGLMGCGGSDNALISSEVCPPAAANAARSADANGDGAVDLADAVSVLRYVTDGGPAPACASAVDLVPNERIDPDDGFSILYHLYERRWGLGDVDPSACEFTAHTTPGCGGIDAGFVVVDDSAGATVELQLSTALAVEGWSVSVSADGCRLTSATVDGTSGAQSALDPTGYRKLGYELTRAQGGSVTSAVLLDTLNAVILPPGERHTLLRFNAESDSCGECTLSLAAPIKAWGKPVDSLVAANGASYSLGFVEQTIKVCP